MPNLLERGETTLLCCPVLVMRVVSQSGQGQKHAKLVKSVLIAVGLHLLHHELEVVPIDCGAS